MAPDGAILAPDDAISAPDGTISASDDENSEANATSDNGPLAPVINRNILIDSDQDGKSPLSSDLSYTEESDSEFSSDFSYVEGNKRSPKKKKAKKRQNKSTRASKVLYFL